MQLDPRDNRDAVYKLLIGCVVPRPIAWVSTVDAAGVNNLAPFSFFKGACNDPPHIAFSSGRVRARGRTPSAISCTRGTSWSMSWTTRWRRR